MAGKLESAGMACVLLLSFLCLFSAPMKKIPKVMVRDMHIAQQSAFMNLSFLEIFYETTEKRELGAATVSPT